MTKDAKPTPLQIETIRGYLETQFPDMVGADRWDSDRYAHIFEIYQNTTIIHLVIAHEFFRDAQNYSRALESMNLAGAVCEADTRRTRITVLPEIQIEPS